VLFTEFSSAGRRVGGTQSAAMSQCSVHRWASMPATSVGLNFATKVSEYYVKADPCPLYSCPRPLPVRTDGGVPHCAGHSHTVATRPFGHSLDPSRSGWARISAVATMPLIICNHRLLPKGRCSGGDGVAESGFTAAPASLTSRCRTEQRLRHSPLRSTLDPDGSPICPGTTPPSLRPLEGVPHTYLSVGVEWCFAATMHARAKCPLICLSIGHFRRSLASAAVARYAFFWRRVCSVVASATCVLIRDVYIAHCSIVSVARIIREMLPCDSRPLASR
jgi:hypothetical protein